MFPDFDQPDIAFRVNNTKPERGAYPPSSGNIPNSLPSTAPVNKITKTNVETGDKASIATAIKYSGDSVISSGTLTAHGKMVIKIEEEDFVTFRFAQRNDETSTKGMIDVRVKTHDAADELDLSCTLYDIAAKRKQMRFSVGAAKSNSIKNSVVL